MHREREVFVCCLLGKNEEMISTRQNCEMSSEPEHGDGEGRGVGQRELSGRLMKSITSMELIAQDVGASMGGASKQSCYQISEEKKNLFQNVFGGKNAKLHICTEPNAGKDLLTAWGPASYLTNKDGRKQILETWPDPRSPEAGFPEA